jgi:NADH-quinone oxidoreductase E subunit
MAVQLSKDAKARFDAIVAQYPHREAALLPVLHLATEEFGHLSAEVQALVATELGVPPVRVREVTTFYEMYHEHAEGQFHLEVCTNIACHLAGADRLVDHCKKKLGVQIGHQTEDGVFGLMEAECLASCGSAPAMRVGLDYYEHLTPDALDFLIAKFRRLAPELKGKNYAQGPEGAHVGPVPGFEPPRPVVHPDAPQPPKPEPAEDAEKGGSAS